MVRTIDVTRRTIGVNFNRKGIAEILLWAPLARNMELLLSGKGTRIPMHQAEYGYWTLTSDELKVGDRYRFVMDSNEYPDPASLSQPEGVHGPSQALDINSFGWTDGQWNNLALEEYILYELHIGTFTPEGTFAALEQKLDYLKELGITAIELMPLAQFPGNRNWGYDGVYPFAVQSSYGGARALKQLVNACHQKGLAVVLDVVYNHLGPEGNYLSSFAPYFTDKYHTPWGNAINFDDAWCDGVRHYYIENALMWFRDFHIDALRLDAVHAIKDFSPVHILQEIKQHTDALMQATGRTHYLIVELDLNDNRFINPLSRGGYGMDAQWVDEFHHALRVAAGEEQTGYYSDFNGIEHLAKAYRDAYVYDGQYSPHRKKSFGVRAEHNGGKQFVVFSQNHDQVGNRLLGERTSLLVSFEMQKLLAGAVLVSPYLPMLYMGEEWSEPAPFLYFVSHTDPDLIEAVRKGRKEEFAAFHLEAEAPDPESEDTFLKSKLQWQLLNKEPHSTMHRYYQALIALRKKLPALCGLNRQALEVSASSAGQTLLLHRWSGGQHLFCAMNFSKEARSVAMPLNAGQWRKVFDSAHPNWKGPASAPDTLKSSDSCMLQPESLVIYTGDAPG